MIQAGFFETDITASIGMERPCNYFKQHHTAVHDPLKVRACVLEDGRERVATVGVDTCAVGSGMVQRARRAIQEACGIPEKSILIAASHTHAGGSVSKFHPDDLGDAPELIRRLALVESICVDPDYERRVIAQIMTAVVMADRRKQEVRLSVGRGSEGGAVFNRRFRLKNGRCATHPGKGNADIVGPAGPIDPEVGVIAVWDRNDTLLGCIVNYACHATCYGAGVSADWIYSLEQTVQGVMGRQARVVFLNGACGDVTQVDNQSLRAVESGEEASRRIGVRVGAEALKVLVSAEKGEQFNLGVLSEDLVVKRRRPSPDSLVRCRAVCERLLDQPRKTTEFHFAKERLLLEYLLSKSDVQSLEIQAVKIGPAVLLANPAEYFCQYGLDIKQQSHFPFTFVVGLANGICGYVPTEDAFDPVHGGGYETVLTSGSNLEVGAGRKILEKSLELARRLKPDAVPVGERVEPSREVWSFGALGPERE